MENYQTKEMEKVDLNDFKYPSVVFYPLGKEDGEDIFFHNEHTDAIFLLSVNSSRYKQAMYKGADC